MFKLNLKSIVASFAVVAIVAGTITSCKCDKKQVKENGVAGTSAGTGEASPGGDSLNAHSANSTAKISTEVSLPSGVKLNAYQGGIEEQMVAFYNSAVYKNGTEEILKSKWFNFDNINFKFGTAELTEESKVQLDNLATILKEFKDVKIKLGAYTDKKGDDKNNMTLSQKRVDALKVALTAKGVGAQISGAEGYGETMATVDENASDEARAIDRKTAIRFVK